MCRLNCPVSNISFIGPLTERLFLPRAIRICFIWYFQKFAVCQLTESELYTQIMLVASMIAIHMQNN